MRATTIFSAALLAVSGAALAQISTAPEPKPGAAQAGAVQTNLGAPDNSAENGNDPGKP